MDVHSSEVEETIHLRAGVGTRQEPCVTLDGLASLHQGSLGLEWLSLRMTEHAEDDAVETLRPSHRALSFKRRGITHLVVSRVIYVGEEKRVKWVQASFP